jgi:hypothetical protein
VSQLTADRQKLLEKYKTDTVRHSRGLPSWLLLLLLRLEAACMRSLGSCFTAARHKEIAGDAEVCTE